MRSLISVSQFLLAITLVACAKDSDSPGAVPPDTMNIAGDPPGSTPIPSVPEPSPTGCAETRLQGAGIGELRISASVASVKRACLVGRDTTITGAEGMPARIISVAVGGEQVEAEIVNDKVWRLAVKSPRFRTADSLGVGTTLERLLQLREPRGMMGEGALYFASPAHCGLSFRLSENRPLPASGQNWNAAALRRLPASTKVTEVLAVGC